MKKGDKRKLILDTMQELMMNGISSTATMNDVAVKAGIAKGSIYYYFESKDQIIDSVIERCYSKSIEDAWKTAQCVNISAIEKLKAIFNMSVYPDENHRQSQLLQLLHLQDDLIIHQKFCVLSVREMTPILTNIIEQGIEENILKCKYPKQYAEFILSAILLALDRILIPCDREEINVKLMALAQLLEDSMSLQQGSFEYLYK